MMLAVEFADFGFGTVVGAVVAGFIAIFLDKRRRTDEKKNRLLEERRLMYRNVAQAFDVMAQQVVLFGKFQPYFRKVEELDSEAQEIVQQAFELLQRSLATTKEQYREHGIDFSLLGSREAKNASTSALETLQQMLACIGADEPCDWTWMQVILEHQLQNFHYFARQDLGMDA